MKAVFAETPYSISLRDIQKPRPKDDEVIIKVAYAGVCGSDLHAYRGEHAFRKPPVMLGHEVSGIVTETGKDVKAVGIGDAVTVMPQVGCGTCAFCQHGAVNLCKNKTLPGTDYWIGTFAEYFVAPERTVLRLGQVPLRLGVLCEPLAVAVHVMKRAKDHKTGDLIILGAGTIGLMLLAIASLYGFDNVLVTDIQDYNLEMAERLGAAHTVNVAWKESNESILKAFGQDGAETVIIAAGGTDILKDAISYVRPGGMLVYFAMITKNMTLNTYPIVFKELNIYGSLNYSLDDFEEAIRILGDPSVQLEPIITHEIPMTNGANAFEILDKRTENAIKILLQNEI